MSPSLLGTILHQLGILSSIIISALMALMFLLECKFLRQSVCMFLLLTLYLWGKVDFGCEVFQEPWNTLHKKAFLSSV